MKKTTLTKLLGIVLIMALVMSMGITALAADPVPNTITISNAVNGETYTAYKLLDASYDKADNVLPDDYSPITYFYTGTATDPLYVILAKYFQFDAFQDGKAYLKVVDASGKAIDYSTVDVAAMAKEINDEVVAGNLTLTEAGHATASGGKAEITVTDKGYYFVDTTLGSVCAIDTAAKVEIQEKNTTTTQDKTVQENSTSQFGDKDDAKIGDTVNFKSTVKIAKYQKNVVFHDIMQTDKLDIDWSSIAVTGADGHHTILTPTSDTTHGNFPTAAAGTTDPYEGDTFAVQFDNDWTSALTADTEVTITYSAKLTAAAIVGPNQGAMDAGNDNKSSVTYGDAQRTEWDYTRTYTWEVDVFKYTKEGSSETPLAGAKFNFKDEDGNAMAFIDLGVVNNVQTYRVPDASETSATTVTELVTPASGKIAIIGLDANNANKHYTLTETDAPTGYNKLTEDITVTITSNTDANGQKTDGSGVSDGSASVKYKMGAADEATGEVKVLNQSGTVLPSTGGIGTTIFYVVGSILVVAAGVLLITKKRMSREG